MDISPAPMAALAAVSVALAWQTRRDLRDYSAFKAMRDTLERRAFYRKWTLASWAFFALGAIAILAALGRLEALFHFPDEFRQLALAHTSAETMDEPLNAETALGMALGLAIGLTLSFLIWRARLRKMKASVVGDVEPLLPRERGEYPYTAALAVTAGITEEMFFRVAIPLLALAATGSTLAAFVVALVIFSMMHWYQGIRGVIAVTAIGALFTWLYLSSGSLVKPIAAHILVDLIALVIRPALSARLAARRITAAPIVHAV